MPIACSSSLAALAVSLALSSALPAAAQDTAAPATMQQEPEPDAGTTPDPTLEENTIVVSGTRLRGQVDAPQPPLLELSAADITAYGAGSIDELLQQLTPQISSARGRGGGGGPVILVNGVRNSSFRELRSYPPEAIEKVEVFPEEVAQRYGYSPDQRVVNFILKDNFTSREIEAEFGQPGDGGYSTQEVEGTYLMIDGPSRLNFNLGWNNSSPLSEAERGIDQTNPPTFATDPDPALYRSLVSDTAGIEATGNWTTRLGESGNSLSVNATFERDDTLRLQGLDSVQLTNSTGGSALRTVNPDDPLRVDSRTESYALGSTLNFGLGEWNLTGTADASQVNSLSRIERRLELAALAPPSDLALDRDLGTFPDAGADEARTRTTSAATLVTARGNPLLLPAGDVSVTLDAGYNWNRIRSEDTRGTLGEIALIRGNLTAGANVGIPLTSRDDDVLGAAGDISLNLSAGLDHLSDFGTLYDWTVGLTWGLTERLSVNASYINRDSAPSLAQLGNPEIARANVSVYDFETNSTALVTVITDGNPVLPAQSQSDWKLGVAWELPFIDEGNFSVDYIRNHSQDVAASFPVLTPTIEAAYPGRITRDAAGRLVQIDERPVSFAEQDVERLQFGLNLSGQIGGDGEGGGGGGFGGRGGLGALARAAGGGGSQGAGPGAPPAATGAGPGAGPGAGSGAGAFDPARIQAMRQVLCGENGADAALRLARGESVTGADGQPVTLPPRMLERLRANGKSGAEQVEQLRQRICSSDGPPGAGARAQGGGQGGGQGEWRGRGQRRGNQGGAGGPGGGAGLGRGGPGGPGGGGRGGGGGGGGGRWFLNLQYTLDLANEVLVAPGGPLLDLLDGDALTGGGQARHSANARLGVFYGGFGSFLNASYTGASRIEGTGLMGSSDLEFADFATLDWRMFVDLGQQARVIEAVPLLDDTRLSFSIDNIFDARQRVTDDAGIVPQRYQPFLIDPVGRSFEIELRKLF